MPNDNHYAEALRELTGLRPDRGLFARCFAESDGEEAATKALYLKRRATQIEAEEKIETERTRREAEESELSYDAFAFEHVPLNSYSSTERMQIYEAWRLRKVEEIQRKKPNPEGCVAQQPQHDPC